MSKLEKIKDDEYEIIDKGADSFHHIRLAGHSRFPEVVYQYGSVKLQEVEGELKVSFEYEVFENPEEVDTNSKEFIDYLGNILVTNLDELLLYNMYRRKNNG
jgi:hypothetical protein